MNEVTKESRGCPILNQASQKKADQFLLESGQFKLGRLVTETPNPITSRLSELATKDLSSAIRLFNQVDRTAIQSIEKVSFQLDELQAEIKTTLDQGGRIFFCGCGATGRLSISLETLWRELAGKQMEERVFSFIAGGDYALVKSIENFEDHPEYGVRQLRDLGFRSEDLLVAITEGGETPFVIGAAQFAASFSVRNTYFLFCNPPDLLKQTALRSKEVLENPRIKSIYFETGPMALSGSTRLQATTVQQLAAGACLLSYLEPRASWREAVDQFREALVQTDFSKLAPLIEAEAEVYASQKLLIHETDRFGVTVLTDTTERTPTFSLLPFESKTESGREPSWTYLHFSKVPGSMAAWKKVLGRAPRCLDWPEVEKKFGQMAALEFDFSKPSPAREARGYQTFAIQDQGDLTLSLGACLVKLPMPKHLLNQHLLVKVCLNVVSTLVMARLGRIQGNIMIYVRPTNKKLIDRSIRYVQWLLNSQGKSGFSYEQICYALFEEMEKITEDTPIVPRVYQRLLHQK